MTARTLTPTALSGPPLACGDQLDADEFFRRYCATADVKKAELIDGVVYMPSPVSHGFHGRPNLLVDGWLAVYLAGTPGVDASTNATVKLGDADQPQPDAMLFLIPEAGGRVTTDAGRYIVGAPDLVVEVSASTASLDRNAKLRAYERHAVREYVILRVYDGAVDWFTLTPAGFAPGVPDPADGVLKSAVFPGLWLDPAALVRGDMAGVLAALQRGLASPEHAAFVADLRARAAAPAGG